MAQKYKGARKRNTRKHAWKSSEEMTVWLR